MTIRIEFPFAAQFEVDEFGSNSREIRTQVLQNYLRSSGMELGSTIDDFQVTSFRGEDNGEFWQVGKDRRY